jgi:hypothetical protein
MRSLTFFSTAVKAMSRKELAALCEECTSFDGHVGVTGMLLHRKGSFLQVLEGRSNVVSDMMVRIESDPRHKDLRIICDRVVAGREFDGPLGFEDLDALPEDTPFLNSFDYNIFAADPELAHQALVFFFHMRQRPVDGGNSSQAAYA